MKKTFRISAVVLSALLFAISSVNAVLAMSTADAVEPIDTSKACSLSLTYAVGDKKMEGLEIEAFRVASVTSDFIYGMTGDFSSYSVEINGIRSQTEWDEIKDTVTAYIAADKIAPTSSLLTDADGVVKFENLPVGIYYIRWTGNETADKVEGFAPFLIAVPGLGSDGKWIYDVEALPKPGKIPDPEKTGLTVIKLWRDDSHDENRPDKIDVDIYKNGELYESVQLSAADNWTYTVQADEVCTWTAVERNVPEGYTVSVQNTDGCTVQITNTHNGNDDPPPYTGDASNLAFWIVLTAVSGSVLILFGIRRRKEDEE